METPPPNAAAGAPRPGRRRFPRAARLTRHEEFRRVRREGKAWPGRCLTLAVLAAADPGPSRVGFITARPIGGAVARSRVRRRLREIVRLARPQLATGCWIVLIAKRRAATASSECLRRDWQELASRAGLWRGAR